MEKYLTIDNLNNNNFNNWDPNKFNWEKDSSLLPKRCSKYFKIWWDPNKFNWKDASRELVEYCSDYIHIWWDPEKYNWERFSDFLVDNCSRYIDIWWNVDNLLKSNSFKLIFKSIIENKNIDKKYKLELSLLVNE